MCSLLEHHMLFFYPLSLNLSISGVKGSALFKFKSVRYRSILPDVFYKDFAKFAGETPMLESLFIFKTNGTSLAKDI